MTGVDLMLAWSLQGVLRTEVLHNALWRWATLLGVLVLTFLVGKSLGMLLQRQVRRLADGGRHELLRVLVNAATGPLTMVVFAGGFYLAQTFLVLDVSAGPQGRTVAQATGPIRSFWIQTAQTIAALGVAWFIYRLVDLVDYLLRNWIAGETGFGAQLVPMIRKALRVFILVLTALFVAQNIFQLNVGALLAGLGIGGLALALAAQDALSNFFGSIVIFADRPFQIGDRIQIREYDGVVQEIGFRSTRMALLTGNQVTIPNSLLAKEPVENIGRRPSIRRVLNVTVTYDTPPEKVQRAAEILREILDARRDRMDPANPPQVYFNEFNADSLNLVVYYWFAPPDWWRYLAFCHEVNLEILRRFNAEGIEFAFPTQTLYLRGEAGKPLGIAPPQPPAKA